LQKVTGGKVICADISEIAIGKCREKGLEAQRIEAGMAELPFPCASFDLVVMAEVVEHLINPAQALDEVHRVLKPNGHLLLSTPNLACFPNRFLLALGFQPLFAEASERHVVGRGLRTLGQKGQPVGHLRLYTKRALLEFLEQCKFRTVKLRGVPFHEAGLSHGLERLTGVMPSLAMILVVVARPK
jgi:2-polyprenyl-3-methyl-5-hydroxy-6-metoxy-1,4-benzoquinol methylase